MTRQQEIVDRLTLLALHTSAVLIIEEQPEATEQALANLLKYINEDRIAFDLDPLPRPTDWPNF